MSQFENEMDDYKYVGVGRDDGKEAAKFSAILYNLQKLDILDEGTFGLSEALDEISVGWDTAMVCM